ncbi:hypothetical protein PFISCL1PPCAC_13521 [Pristionchus fissidentatus]|uniref:G protein-coupled receptor n=1 Tax=Pristionchus fissidentatus TaxID=1538716 RepID=A0AAV5VWX0_9BILA|nr:hypothetical protein PFISCL1PPCAC_13521 [Pristionchus fissidentatus]
MQRPQIYCFYLPITVISLLLYIRILFVLWEKRESYDSLFYKLIRTQVFRNNQVIVFFIYEIPQDWPAMYPFLFTLNSTVIVQLVYAQSYFCVNGQAMDQMSMIKVILIHFLAPLALGAYIFFGEEPSRFEFQPVLNRVARVTEMKDVQFNSIVSFITSISGATISSFCYILIFVTLRKRPIRSWNQEASILISSFILFLCLCAIAIHYFLNALFSVINVDAMYTLRMHYYAASFPISLLNPWCLILTSG